MKVKPKRTFTEKNSSSFFTKSLAFLACFFLMSMTLSAQTKTVTGKVVDEQKEALIGVSIRIVGSTVGVITDIDGAYAIQAKENDVLEFSYIGMASQSIKVGASTKIDVMMKEDSKVLAETVVIGYGTAKKRDLTGSITTIKASDIADRPSANPLASMQGKVAGVQVINSGRAGQDPEIRMRGTNSIDGYKPLYVVDGLFTDNINYLNSSDIETMEVLKDASSLAIFGIRGANGVIIITTKRAKEGQTMVNLNSSVGWKTVNHRVDLANATQFKELYDEQLLNQKVAPFKYDDWQANTDWQDEIFQTGFMSNNNVSITGSSAKNTFYLGLGYTSEEGSIKSEKFSKITVNLNSDYKVTDKLKFGFQVNAARMLPPDAKSVQGAVRAAPITPTHYTFTDPLTNRTEILPHITPSFQSIQVFNPYINIETEAAHNKATNHRVSGNIYGELEFAKNFTFRTAYSYDFGVEESRQYMPIRYFYDPASKSKINMNERETIMQEKATRLAAQSDYILTYTNKFGSHGITAMAGVTTNYNDFSKLTGRRSQDLGNFDISIPNDNPDKWWLTILGQDAMENGGEQYRKFSMSYLARALYNYKNRYLLNTSFRRDGSSLFRNSNNTWDNFYTFGGGWVVSEESFMQNVTPISYLKLKGSWGVLGSENTAGRRYPTYPQLTNGAGSAVFGDNIVPSWSEQYRRNTQLHWEKTYSWEVGFELSMLDQRLKIDPTYYSKTTKGILVLLDQRSGFQSELTNLGDIRNKGLELSASWSDKIGSTGFRYSINGNFTTIDNEVLSLGENGTDTKYAGPDNVARTQKGHPIGSFYGYKVVGIYQNNTDVKEYLPTLFTVAPGDFKFADVNGDGKIDQSDRTEIGNPTPDFTYGLNLGLNYKNFDLSADIMGVYGNEIYRNTDRITFTQTNYLANKMGRWNGEGTSNWEPILNTRRSVNYEHSTYYIEDGSFFRLRNIQLGYTFAPEVLSKIYMKSIRLYGNIQNLKTWSKNSGYTPEIGGDAIKFGIDDSDTYPMPTIYTVGVNITF